MLISDWSSDVCSSDLACGASMFPRDPHRRAMRGTSLAGVPDHLSRCARQTAHVRHDDEQIAQGAGTAVYGARFRSEEHTSELQSLMRISYAVFCLKKKKIIN